MMFDFISFGISPVQMATFSLPDTSGLAPLEIPPEFFEFQNSTVPERRMPSEGAVRRFQAAMENPTADYRIVAEQSTVEPPKPFFAEPLRPIDVDVPVRQFVAVEQPKDVAPAPVKIEVPVTNGTPVTDETPVTVETSVTAKTPATVETPIEVKAPATHETPVTFETPVAADAPKQPVVESPKTIVAEIPQPAVVESPVAVEAPVAVETPAAVVAPVTIDRTPEVATHVVVEPRPVAVEAPITVSAPAPIASAPETVIVEAPVVAAAPASVVTQSEPVVANPEMVDAPARQQMVAEAPKPVVVEAPKTVVSEAPRAVASEVPSVGVVEAPQQVAAGIPPVTENASITPEKPVDVAMPIPAETPMPVKDQVVVERPMTVEMPSSVEMLSPVEKPVPVEMPSPVERPVVVERPAAGEKTAIVDEPVSADEKKPFVVEAPSALPVTPNVVPQAIDAVAINNDVSVATARTVAIVEAVEEIVHAVSAQIEVTPSLVKGEGEILIRLKPTVLEGSEIKLSAKDNALSVIIVPATPSVEQVVSRGIPQLEIALAEHLPTFGSISVAVAKKGKSDESK